MRIHLTRSETALLLAAMALPVVALLAPAVPNPAHAHDFADQRVLWGVPYALDVLSNLPFALLALAGGWTVWLARRGLGKVECALAGLFFAGLALTAAGSAWYHLRPDDAGLAIDRFAMSVAFAGLLGLGAATRVSERAGAALGLGLIVFAPASVAAWSATGNVLPWAVVQFGGMAAVLAFGSMRAASGALRVNWFLVLAAYAIAKLLEVNDHAVYELTGHLVAGHTLKHVIAAFAALPVISALGTRVASVQNGRLMRYREEAR